jgi:hypothetical protein
MWNDARYRRRDNASASDYPRAEISPIHSPGIVTMSLELSFKLWLD